MKVLRVYHGGRDPSHRARDRALMANGVDLTLVIPSTWPEPGAEPVLTPEPFRVVELAVSRAGSVNSHGYAKSDIVRVLAEVAPDLVDLHEEPFCVAGHQWLAQIDRDTPVVMYTAQNIDKRYPPPFCGYERSAHRRIQALYPCSRQAASVARGKGFGRLIEVIPLAYDDRLFVGEGRVGVRDPLRLGFVGRLQSEKGLLDAVRVLGAVNRVRPATLSVVGEGPERENACQLAGALDIADRVDFLGWLEGSSLAAACRAFDILLVPSLATSSWVEQFGRVIIEAQACGVVVAGYESGSIPEVAGVPALLSAVGDWRGLADLVVTVSSQADDLERRSREGLERVGQFTWDTIGRRHADFYLRAADRSGSRQVGRWRSQRAVARAEFGPPAMTPAGYRPLALPRVLRRR